MRTFAIYSDFVVREIGIANGLTMGETGRFFAHQRAESFTPYIELDLDPSLTRKEKYELQQFEKNREKPKSIMNKLEIEGEEIKLNTYFTLIGIIERPDSSKANYRKFFREICLEVRDPGLEKKEFKFLFDPFKPMTYLGYQDCFLKLRAEIQGSQTFREIELKKKIKEKDIEIERLKQQLNNMKD